MKRIIGALLAAAALGESALAQAPAPAQAAAQVPAPAPTPPCTSADFARGRCDTLDATPSVLGRLALSPGQLAEMGAEGASSDPAPAFELGGQFAWGAPGQTQWKPQDPLRVAPSGVPTMRTDAKPAVVVPLISF